MCIHVFMLLESKIVHCWAGEKSRTAVDHDASRPNLRCVRENWSTDNNFRTLFNRIPNYGTQRWPISRQHSLLRTSTCCRLRVPTEQQDMRETRTRGWLTCDSVLIVRRTRMHWWRAKRINVTTNSHVCALPQMRESTQCQSRSHFLGANGQSPNPLLKRLKTDSCQHCLMNFLDQQTQFAYIQKCTDPRGRNVDSKRNV